MFDIERIRRDFPMLRGKTMQGKPLIFLDNASTTFKPDCVIAAINRYYNDETSNSHRGDYDLCYVADQTVARARKTVASFLNADEKEIIFTAGATDGLNLVAYGYGMKFLKPGDEIVLSLAEHASNVLPWFRVAEMTGAKIVYAPLKENGALDVEKFESVLSERTKIVSLAYVGNVLGYIYPVKELAAAAHKVGAVFVVDGAQSTPHIKTDVKDLDCDFLAFSGHKLCAPTGIGVLYGKYELLDSMDPFECGGGMNVKFSSDGRASFLPPPSRFEAGTMNIAGIYGLAAAIEYLNSIGMDAIHEHEVELKRYAVEKLQETGMAEIYNADSPSGIVTFNIKGVFAQDAGTFLNSKGIACRSGLHCAKMLPEAIHELATLRASFYFYTTKEDIDALADAVKQGGDFLDAYF